MTKPVRLVMEKLIATDGPTWRGLVYVNGQREQVIVCKTLADLWDRMGVFAGMERIAGTVPASTPAG